jgi:anti-sigma regulatory factor (Ser/Thr protein kinase)
MARGQREFAGKADQVGLARRFVLEALDPGSSIRDDVGLLVSEGVTNALLHSSSGREHGTFTVGYSLSDTSIRVEIRDGGGPAQPRRRVHDLESMTGRGLDLFEALADRWGHRGDERARVVWFEIDLHEEMRHGGPGGAVRSSSARP